MSISPIGYVRNPAQTKSDPDQPETAVIEVLPEYQEGLDRIEESREIIVLFVFDRSTEVELNVHPRGDPSNPLVGVFASRSPNRPNHIGLTQVQLLRREGRRLVVKGLDALDGSPVIDIKPAVRLDQRDISQK